MTQTHNSFLLKIVIVSFQSVAILLMNAVNLFFFFSFMHNYFNRLVTTKKKVFLHGDFNVNHLISNANSNTLTNTITALRHVCTIICLSCTTNLSNSLFDLCITNSNNFACEILIYDINDHLPIFICANKRLNLLMLFSRSEM